MPGTTRYSATFDRTYEEEDRVDPSPPPTSRRSRSQSWQANSGLDGTRPYTPLGGRPFNQRSSSTDNGPPKGPEHIPTRTVGKTAVKAHSNPFQFVKIGTCPLYRKAEDQLKKKEVKQPEVLKEEEEWQSNLDSWKSRRRKMSEDVFRRQEEIRQLEQLEEQANQMSQKKTKTFSEMVESRQHRGRALSLCLISSPMELQNWEFESNSHKNGSCSSTFSGESEENSTVNSDDEGVSLKGMLDKSQNDLHNHLRTNGDSHIEKNDSGIHNSDYNKLSDLTTNDLQMKQKEGSYIDSGLESISSHRAGDTPDSGSDFSHDSGSSIDCESPRTGVNILEEFCAKPSQMSPGHEVTVKLCLNEKGQDFGFTFLGGKNEGQVIVASVLEGSQADLSSIHLGDQIIMIDGQELSSKKHIEIAGIIQKAREKGEVTLLLWRHSKSPVNGATNGFSKSENQPQNAAKPEKSQINGSKTESHQYEKSIESENEMFVDDFDELQEQSDLLSSNGQSKSLVQANGNISPSTKVVSNHTLSESSSSFKPKSVSNGFIEKPVKNAQKINSDVDNENEGKRDVKVQNKTRRKGVYSLNVSPDTVLHSKERTVHSLFPLSPVTELPSPDEAKTMADTLASNLTSVYDSQKENVSKEVVKEADAKSPLIKEDIKSPVTANAIANSKNVPLGILKTVSPQNETQTDSTVPSSPSISKNTELNTTGSPQDVKPKLVLKKVKPKTKKVIASENTSAVTNEVSANSVPVSSTVAPTKSIMKDPKVTQQNEQKEEKVTCESNVVDTSKAMVNMPAATTTETAISKAAPSNDMKNNPKDESKRDSVVTLPTATVNGEKSISVESFESAKPNVIRKKVKKIKKAPAAENVTPAPSQAANNVSTSSVPNSSSDLSKNVTTKPPVEVKCIPSSEDKKVTVTNEHKKQNSSDDKISTAEVVTSKNKMPIIAAVTTSKDNAAAVEIKKEEPTQSSTLISNGQEFKSSTAFSQSQKVIPNITTKKILSKPKENVNSSFATKPVCHSAGNVKSPNSPTASPPCNVSSSKNNEKEIESVATPEMSAAQNEPKSSVNSQDPKQKSPKKRNKSRSRKKNANSQKANSPAKQTEEFKNIESLNIVFQSEPKNIKSEKLSNVKNSEISCGNTKTSIDLVPDIPPVEKVAEEMEKLILEQLEEEERAKELASGLQMKSPISSPEHLLIAPPKLAEPPKEKPPPPPQEGNQKDTSLKRVNSTKRIKKEICKRRSNFLGIDNAEGSLECSEPSIPPPPALEEILKAEMELDRQSRLKVESASTARLTREEKEIMQREKEIIESLESEERQRMLLNSNQEFNNVSPNTINDAAEEERIQYLKDERKRLEAERLNDEQQLQLIEEKQLREREELIRKQEANKSAVPLSAPSLSIATNVPNILQPSLTSLSADTQSSVSVSGTLGDGKSLISISAPDNSSSEPSEKEKVLPQKPAVPPKPLKKKEAIRKERERLRQEQEALVREREEHRRKLLQEQEELLKHQNSHALEAPVSRLGPLPPLLQPNFQPPLTSPPTRDSASFPSRSCHGDQSSASGSPNSAELMGPVAANQYRVNPPRKTVQHSDAWGQQKETENSPSKHVSALIDAVPNKMPSLSESDITNDTTKEKVQHKPKVSSEIDGARTKSGLKVKEVVKVKENKNITKSVLLPNDVTPSKAPKTTSLSKPVIANDAVKEQGIIEQKVSAKLDGAKEESSVNVIKKKKNVSTEPQESGNAPKSVPLPNDVTLNKAPETLSSFETNITNDAATQQVKTVPKANAEADFVKRTNSVKVKKVVKKKETENSPSKHVSALVDAVPNKMPSLSESDITNDTTKEKVQNKPKVSSEIDGARTKSGLKVKEVVKVKENQNVTKSVLLPNDVTPSKAPKTTSLSKPVIANDAVKEQGIIEPKVSAKIDGVKEESSVNVIKKKENVSTEPQENGNVPKSVPLPNDVTLNKAPETLSSFETNITNDVATQQVKTVPKANAEADFVKRTNSVKVKKVVKKKETENSSSKHVSALIDAVPNKMPSLSESDITNDTTKEKVQNKPKVSSEIGGAKTKSGLKVKEVVKVKENQNVTKSVLLPNDVTPSKAPKTTSLSKPVITNDGLKEQGIIEPKVSAKIDGVKEESSVNVIKKKENVSTEPQENGNVPKSVPLPNDVTLNKAPKTLSSFETNITNDAATQQVKTVPKANAEADFVKKTNSVKVKKVVKKKEKEDDSAKSNENVIKLIQIPNSITSNKAPDTPSSSKPDITNDATKEQTAIDAKSNSEKVKKMSGVKIKKVIKIKRKEMENKSAKLQENGNNISKSALLPNDVTSSKAPEIVPSSKLDISNDATKGHVETKSKEKTEIDKVKAKKETKIIKEEKENGSAKSWEDGNNVIKSVSLSNDVNSSKLPETTPPSKPNIPNDALKEHSVTESNSNTETDCVKRTRSVKIKKMVKKKENGNNSVKSQENENSSAKAQENENSPTKSPENENEFAKSVLLSNDVTPKKLPETTFPSEPNVANNASKEQVKIETKANTEIESAKKTGGRKVKKVVKKENGNNCAKSVPLLNDATPNKAFETTPPSASITTNGSMKEQTITEPKAIAEIDNAKKKNGGKVKRVVKKKTPSVRKQNQDSLTESRYNQNHWLIQEAEMRRIAELKERQRSCSQTHLAEDDVCSNPPRVPVISPTHNQHLNFAVQDKMWNYNQPGVPIKKYPPPVVKEQLHTIYPRETASQQPPMKPSRVVPMERKEQMLSVSGRKRCSHCNEELGRGAAMIIESLQLYYHIHCFQCCVCQAQLGNGSCGADVRVRNQKLHCNNCYSNDEAGLKFSQV